MEIVGHPMFVESGSQSLKSSFPALFAPQVEEVNSDSDRSGLASGEEQFNHPFCRSIVSSHSPWQMDDHPLWSRWAWRFVSA